MPADPRLVRSLVPLLGEAELSALVDEARAEARKVVRARLVEAMTEAMLGQVRARTPGTGEPRGPRAGAERQGPTALDALASDGEILVPSSAGDDAEDTLLWAYCVVRAGSALPAGLAGVSDSGLELIRHADLGVVVGRVPAEEYDEEPLRRHLEDMDWLERTARAHQGVIDEIAAITTLIPMRMCTVYRDDAGVVEMLRGDAEALARALAHLRGKAEWGVKAYVTRSEEDAPAERPDEEPRSGTDYLKDRRRHRDARRVGEARHRELCREIHEQLSGGAEASLVNPAQRPEVSGRDEPMLLNGVYLVRDEHRDRFLRLVRVLQERHQSAGLLIEPTGPWPAYHFIPGTIGAAW